MARWHRPLARLVLLVLIAGVTSAVVRAAGDDSEQPSVRVAATSPDSRGESTPLPAPTTTAPEWAKVETEATTTTVAAAPDPEVTTTTPETVPETTVPTTEAPTITTTAPPVTTARVQLSNQHLTTLDVVVNGVTSHLPPGGFEHVVVEADPYGDGWGNDVIQVMVTDAPGCGYGDSDTWFEPGGRYVVTFVPVGQNCQGGLPAATFQVQMGLPSTG